MKKILMVLCAVTLVFGMVDAASATTWTDTHHPPDAPLYMAAGGENEEYSFTLDIKNDGFDPGFFGYGADDVLWYKVELYVADDLGFFFTDALDLFGQDESLMVSTGWFLSENETSYNVDFHGGILNDPLYYDMSWNGLISINLLGAVGINLTATDGDFYFGKGRIIASDTAPVPEPATMLLLGTGLLGLAVVGRKKIKK